MNSPWFQLVVAVLAAWRVAHMVAHEDGPLGAIVALRVRAGAGGLGRMMDCPYCVSMWAAAPLSAWMADTVPTGVVLWLAISGGACLLEYGVAALRSPI